MRTGAAPIRQLGSHSEISKRQFIAALPVATVEAAEKLRDSADRLICAHAPAYFDAVGAWYQDFQQISDQQVQTLLAEAQHRERALPPSAGA